MTSVKPFLLTENGAIYGSTKRYFPDVSFEHHLFPVFPEQTVIPYDVMEKFNLIDKFTDDIIANAETWCEPEYEDVNAMVFYCDSLPDTGSVDTSGDGTVENPFLDLRHALKVIYCYYALFCGKIKFVLNVSGTVDYSVELPNADFKYSLIIDFDEAEPVDSSGVSFWLYGTIIKNLVFKGRHVYAYSLSNGIVFLNCDLEAIEYISAKAIYNSTVKAESINGTFFVKSSAEVDGFGAANVKDSEISAETIRSGDYSYPIFLDSEISCDNVGYSGGWYDHYAHSTFLHCDLEVKNYCYSFMAKKSTVKASNVVSYYCVDCDCKIAHPTTALPPYRDLFSSFVCGVGINNNIYSVEKLENWSISNGYNYADERLFKNNTVNIKTVSLFDGNYGILPSDNSFDNNMSYDFYPNSDTFSLQATGGVGHIREGFNNNTLTVRVHGNFYLVEIDPGGMFSEEGYGTYNYNFSCAIIGRLGFHKTTGHDAVQNWTHYFRRIVLYGTQAYCNQVASYSYSLEPYPDVSVYFTSITDEQEIFLTGPGIFGPCLGTVGLDRRFYRKSEEVIYCATCQTKVLYPFDTYRDYVYDGIHETYKEYGTKEDLVNPSSICHPAGYNFCTRGIIPFSEPDQIKNLPECQYKRSY